MKMSERIELAKMKAEQQYQEKINASQKGDAGNFFSDEEFERLLSGSNTFSGKIMDIEKGYRLNQLGEAAQWLFANSLDVVSATAETISSSRPNAIVCLELRRLSSLRGNVLNTFAKMHTMADSVFISGIADDVVRVAFGIEGIWKE